VDFAQLTSPDDVVTILATEPLTRDEPWEPLPPGEAVLLRHGEVVRRRQGQTLAGPRWRH
jgi:glutamine amidotransferase